MPEIVVDILILVGFAAIVSAPATVPLAFDKINSMKESKKSRCIHLWRRNDAEYYAESVKYHYFCEKCKSSKGLWDSDAKRFEEDFMSDWL